MVTWRRALRFLQIRSYSLTLKRGAFFVKAAARPFCHHEVETDAPSLRQPCCRVIRWRGRALINMRLLSAYVISASNDMWLRMRDLKAVLLWQRHRESMSSLSLYQAKASIIANMAASPGVIEADERGTEVKIK